MTLGIKAAAERIGQSPTKVRFWIKTGKLKAEKKTIGDSKVPTYQIKLSDLNKLGYETVKPKINDEVEPASIPELSVKSDKIIDWMLRHPDRFGDLTLKEVSELVSDL